MNADKKLFTQTSNPAFSRFESHSEEHNGGYHGSNDPMDIMDLQDDDDHEEDIVDEEYPVLEINLNATG